MTRTLMARSRSRFPRTDPSSFLSSCKILLTAQGNFLFMKMHVGYTDSLIEVILMWTLNISLLYRIKRDFWNPHLSPNLAFWFSLGGSIYPCLEHIFMVPQLFEQLVRFYLLSIVKLKKKACSLYPTPTPPTPPLPLPEINFFKYLSNHSTIIAA